MDLVSDSPLQSDPYGDLLPSLLTLSVGPIIFSSEDPTFSYVLNVVIHI